MNATKLKEFFTAVGSVVSAHGRSAPPIVANAAGVVAEGLESRLLFAVTASHDKIANVLTITGDGIANLIQVYQQDYTPNDQISVLVGGVGPALGPWTVDGDLTLIRLVGAGNSETLQFGNTDWSLIGISLEVPVSVPAEIRGGDGHDTLIGTDQGDTLWGEGGADTLRGVAGADIMYGGYGSSTSPDYSNDILHGGLGADYMFGEDGDDTFEAADNVIDYLDGGDGSDTATNRDPNDSLLSIETY